MLVLLQLHLFQVFLDLLIGKSNTATIAFKNTIAATHALCGNLLWGLHLLSLKSGAVAVVVLGHVAAVGEILAVLLLMHSSVFALEMIWVDVRMNSVLQVVHVLLLFNLDSKVARHLLLVTV
jgi:hypothetical protein